MTGTLIGAILVGQSAPRQAILLDRVVWPSRKLAWDGQGRPVAAIEIKKEGVWAVLTVPGTPVPEVGRFEVRGVGARETFVKDGRIWVSLPGAPARVDLEGVVFREPWNLRIDYRQKANKQEEVGSSGLFPGLMAVRSGEDYGPNGPFVNPKATETRCGVRHRPLPEGFSRRDVAWRVKALDRSGKVVPADSHSCVYGKFEVHVFPMHPGQLARFTLETRRGSISRILSVPVRPKAATLPGS